MTLLQLPHMRVGLDYDDQGEEDMVVTNEDVRTTRSRRSRLDSMGYSGSMGEEETKEDESLETTRERRKREPAHRRWNRKRMSECQTYRESSRSPRRPDTPLPIRSEEDLMNFQHESGMEKTMIEALLRKYGFGKWTQPDETSDKEPFPAKRVSNDLL